MRHYDSGSCKNKLGHSKGTLLWLRFQVVAVFLGFALFLLLLSPLLLISAPILLIAHYFCNLSISTKVWSKDDFPDSVERSDSSGLNLSNKFISNDLNDKPQTSSGQPNDQLIDLSEQTENNESINKNQQLIQAYIQNNGTHKLVNLEQSMRLENSSILDSGLFEKHPIKLAGYDRDNEVEKDGNRFLSWFKWKKSKIDPPPRLSSMLDVEKHREFIEELMADKLSLDHKLNSVDIDQHYMIISRSNDEAIQTTNKPTASWWTFWNRTSTDVQQV